MSGDAIDIVAAVDPRQHRDAISEASVLLQLLAVDGCQLGLVGKVEDTYLGIEIEHGRHFWVVEIEVDEKRSRPRSQHSGEPDGDCGRSVRARREDADSRHPAAPPAGICCWTS